MNPVSDLTIVTWRTISTRLSLHRSNLATFRVRQHLMPCLFLRYVIVFLVTFLWTRRWLSKQFPLSFTVVSKIFLGLLRARKNSHTHIPARTHLYKTTKVIIIFGIATFFLLRKVHGIPATGVTTTYDPRRPKRCMLRFPTHLQEIPQQRSCQPPLQSKFHTHSKEQGKL